MDTVRIGKTRIRIEVEGCIDCGCEHSSGWTLARTVQVQVGGRNLAIHLSRCADCQRSRPEEVTTKLHGGTSA